MKNWEDLGANPKIVQILREGNTLPFWIQPNMAKTIISCYVRPRRNLYLLEELDQLMKKRSTVVGQYQTYHPFQPTIFGPKTQQPVEIYTRSEQTKPIHQGGEIQNGNTRNHHKLPPTRRVGHLNRVQGHLLPHSKKGTG